MSTSQDLEMQVSMPAKTLLACQQQFQDLMLEGISDSDREHINFQPLLQNLDRAIQAWPKDRFLSGLTALNIAVDTVTQQDVYDYFCKIVTILGREAFENLSIDYIWMKNCLRGFITVRSAV
jgi:hypothetical protein